MGAAAQTLSERTSKGNLYNASHKRKLNAYLADIDAQAEKMFSRLVKQMAEKQDVTEQMKAENQMLWVGRMNNIRSTAMEIVTSEMIYN